MAWTTKKKFIVILAVVVILCALLYFLFGMNNNNTTYQAPDLNAVFKNPALITDSDNDGLKDWEEVLWHTDPYNPDTAGDGMRDGVKVKNGRDPLRSGPNNKLDRETVTARVNNQLETDLTDTQKFSRELFIKIIADEEKNSGNLPTTDYQNFLTDELQRQINTQHPTVHNTGELRTAADDGPAALRIYGNAVADILMKKPDKPLEYELTILARAQASDNPNEFLKIADNVAAYKKMGESLLALDVPRSAIAVNLTLINAIAAMAWSLQGFVYVATDPLKALPGISAYADNADAFTAALKSFGPFFVSRGVTFTQDDHGYKIFNAL